MYTVLYILSVTSQPPIVIEKTYVVTLVKSGFIFEYCLFSIFKIINDQSPMIFLKFKSCTHCTIQAVSDPYTVATSDLHISLLSHNGFVFQKQLHICYFMCNQ